ncbi:MAG: alpha/beta fold hydrolase [Actinomycetota bacterium]|nr:alpha/beta fold hydrolase [Actinomycetota bacterium]
MTATRRTPLLPGAEPFFSSGGPVGVLLCHGFTGSPQPLRPWAQRLAAEGLTVALPRLPGHGTTEQEARLTRWPDWYAVLERALADLHTRCPVVFVLGLSMGGTLALRLAEEHPDRVAGLVLVNPSLLSTRRVLRLLPLLRHLVPTVAGVAGDIRKPGVREVAYDRTPLAPLHSLTELWALTRRDLPKVTCPVLLFRSPEDHVVEPASARQLLEQVSSNDVEERLCPDSYHVATLDYDAEAIIAGSLAFVRRLAPVRAPA